MSDTPRTDAEAFMQQLTTDHVVDADFARALERELAEERQEHQATLSLAREARDEIERLKRMHSDAFHEAERWKEREAEARRSLSRGREVGASHRTPVAKGRWHLPRDGRQARRADGSRAHREQRRHAVGLGLRGQDPPLDAPPGGAEMTNAAMWECPECCFRFDAGHTNQNGGYSCPVCSESALRAYAVQLRSVLLDARDLLDQYDGYRYLVERINATVAKGSDDGEVRSPVVGGAQDTQAGGDSGGMPLSVGRSRPDQTATSSNALRHGQGPLGSTAAAPCNATAGTPVATPEERAHSEFETWPQGDPYPWIVREPSGQCWGPFATNEAASKWADDNKIDTCDFEDVMPPPNSRHQSCTKSVGSADGPVAAPLNNVGGSKHSVAADAGPVTGVHQVNREPVAWRFDARFPTCNSTLSQLFSDKAVAEAFLVEQERQYYRECTLTPLYEFVACNKQEPTP
jgi:hypothetical protein